MCIIDRYKLVAEQFGCDFFDAASVAEPGEADSIHLMEEGHLKLAEALAEKVLSLIHIWFDADGKIAEHWDNLAALAEANPSGLSLIHISCKELPFHYFDEELYQMVSGYRRKIFAPKNWRCV